VSSLCRGEHVAAAGDTTLHISPRLHELFEKFQTQCYQQQSNYLTAEYAQFVEEEMKEHKGVTLSNFSSHQLFKELVGKASHTDDTRHRTHDTRHRHKELGEHEPIQ